MKINEIFYSIQGESSLTGLPTVFVRTSGCPLRCTYCDTTYAYFEGEVLSHEKILQRISNFNCKRVCVTGGEPLAQKESLRLLKDLVELNYKVSLETSGSFSCTEVDSRVQKIIDIKTPTSGAKDSFDTSNLSLSLPRSTEFKFVIGTVEDFEWAEDFCKLKNLSSKGKIFYSPSYNELDPAVLAKLILDRESTARLQIQLHKILWPETLRGV